MPGRNCAVICTDLFQSILSMKWNSFILKNLSLKIFNGLYCLVPVLLVIVALLLTLPGSAGASACVLEDQSPSGVQQDGDIILGIVLSLFKSTKFLKKNKFTKKPYPPTCYNPSISYYQHYLAAIFAIEEINQNANILPNLTLGYRIYDACTSESRAAANTLSILTGRAASVPNYSCNDKGTLAAFVGHLLPTLTHVVSDMTTIYRFPQLNNHLKSIHFQTSSGDEIFFNEHGEVQGNLEIENWISYPNETTAIRKVGTFNSSAPPGEQLLINKPDIIWGTPLNDIPQSVCIGTCQPGYRKAGIKGLPACCYECVQCSDGEIANVSDMENCIRCQEDEWSNEKKNKCIKKTIDFLSYAEPLGLSLAMLAILLSITASIVLGIFIRNRQSQIVKANNQELSYSLLLTIILSFLCTLLFIGKPKKVTCLLRQITFAVIFTISISSVLVKTMTVLIAFHAITPGSMLKILVRKSVSRCFILVFSLGEVIICIMWFLHCPPFPDYDTRSSVMTLQCNEGSAVAFYIAVGYIGMLASVSFITAYLARGLPDIFNEASHITFSMLVFCCVWITFIPAYISSKGKYMVAVEIFAILSSSSGLLGFIFLPKCYIILLKPEMNVKGKGTSKKK
uniref:G-protein coupled receptors family 3 profile domain-containing protein n=1 Tax=Xenopus tropicalis TaxID=8364 RepID=A0A803JL57_XENTR